MPLQGARNTAFCHAAILDHSEWPCRPLGGILAALVARCAMVGQGPRGRDPGVGGRGQGRQPTSLTTCPRGDVRGHAHAFGGHAHAFGGHAHALGVRLDSPGMSVASRAACCCASGGNRTYTMPPFLTLCNVPRDKRLRTAPLLYPVCRWHLDRNVGALQ